MNISSTITPQEVTAKTRQGLYITDHDGNPRWIWPVENKYPIFLQLFQPITFKQRAFVFAVRLIFLLRLQQLVFPSMPLEAGQYATSTGWAVFTGTPGPNRKRIKITKEGWITKEAKGELAVANLYNETAALQELAEEVHQFSFQVPKLLQRGERGFTMEQLNSRGTWQKFTNQHLVALRELGQLKPLKGIVGEWAEWGSIRHKINQLKNQPHAEIPSGIVTNLLQMVVLENREAPITFGLAHGDFTPWNTLRTKKNKLGIIDWEMAHTEMPMGFDFFHFHLQKGIMLERKTWVEIYSDCQKLLTPATRKSLFGQETAEVDRYLRLYLIYHITYYLSLYQQQAKWHQQIYWQMDVWSDALNALLPQEDQRKALISRFFDVLSSQTYAALKMDHDDPQALHPDSDFDILTTKQDAQTIIARLSNFPHIDSFRIFRKSFMASASIVMKDGQVLNIDLIWKLKRRATVFMNVAGMIQRAVTNSYGIQVVSSQDIRQYVQLFYGLNGANVPEKFGLMETATTVATGLSENKGLSGLGNCLSYLSDTIRSMLFNQGFVLTFSGVDGAGKSTVIDQVVTMLDKKIRRPVKVLRHRPSVLPILSAYRYGKKEAEQRSVARLPRTGSNNNSLSSLVRFSYYYLDYLLGQWYVYLRYVLRGYVVVYDRYYYDFMIDARRSNLQVPSWITAVGFWLLRKPEYNFFLFAPPDTILARKQELTRETIVSLTQRYHSLFEQFQQRYISSVFTNVENIVLEDALTVIRKTLLQDNR
ncbi:MAG: phosphotransferase [Lewinella sp.]